MTSSKKVLGLLLALAMVFGCMTMAFAADPGEAARAASVNVTVSADTLAAGEKATVTVTATTNFTAATWSVPVFYDKTLVSIEVTSVGGTAIATDADAVDASLVYANTGLDAAKYGFVLVQFTADQGQTIADTLNAKEVVAFTVTAKADVEGAAAIVVPAGAKKTTSNVNGKLYFGCSTSGTTITKVPVNVENIDVTAASATVNVGAAADPVLTGVNGGVVDATRMYVYGIPAGEDASKYFAVTDGTFTVEGAKTGAKLVVKNSKGEVFATYTVIIFGDVDGNGEIANADAVAIKGVLAGGTIADAACNFAADVDGNGEIANADLVAVKGVLAGGTITSNPFAA